MKVRMQYGNISSDLSHTRWNIAFYGSDIDDRSKQSIAFILSNSEISRKIDYSPTDFIVNIDNDGINIDEIDSYFSQFPNTSKILIDCTSLGVVEILITLQSLYNNGIRKIDALYLEPSTYNKKVGKIIHKRDFELSSEFEGYIGIPGHTLYLTASGIDKFIFLCGYESERIERAIEDLNINSKRSQFFFGVPAFHSGWEMNSFSNNIRVIENKKMGHSFYFCGASNPMSVCEKLSTIYDGLGGDEKLFLIPVGTKPMALATCIFKVSTNNERLAFLYDHPKKKQERSSDISRWNLYNIEL